MRRIVRVEGNSFTGRRKEIERLELNDATPEEVSVAFRELASWAKSPWESRANVFAAVEADLAKEIERNSSCDFKAREEPGWYFFQLSLHQKRVREAIERGDAEWAAHHAAEWGILLAEFQLWQARGKVFETGRKQTETLADTRENANERRARIRQIEWDRWNAEAACVRAERPHAAGSELNVAKLVKDRLQLVESVHTIRARLKKVDEAG